MTNAKELWFLTRGSGVVALLLLTLAVSLGIVTSLRLAIAGRRFATVSLHRNATLLAITFVALHVLTTIADGYAPIGLQDSIVPFASPYRPIWLGLGTVAFDLLIALVITSYLRQRIGARMWRGTHWLAYAAWPVALLHAFGTGSDARAGWFFWLGIACLCTVAGSVLARIAFGAGITTVRIAGGAAAVVASIGILAWYETGPAQSGWAARAGTPTRLIASKQHLVSTALTRSAPASAATPQTVGSFDSGLTGTVHESTAAGGDVRIELSFALTGAPRGRLRIALRGVPLGGGVSMNASGVSFVPATTRAVYLGNVTGLEGSVVAATVKDAAGHTLQLTARLALNGPNGSASGVLAGAPASSGDAQ